MHILAFADLHANKRHLEQIRQKALKADLVVCAGDISLMGSQQKAMVDALDGMGKIVLMIPGNHEHPPNLEKDCAGKKNIRYIHRKVYWHDKLHVIGWGDGGFARHDPEFEQYAVAMMKRIKDAPLITVFHGPPFKTTLDHIDGKHVGNKSYRAFIEKHQPHLTICGHIHETAKSTDRIGRTLIVNPGPDGMLLKLDI
ncbi:MAG: metallophosphoesterase [Nanoarchaeota archaeon]